MGNSIGAEQHAVRKRTAERHLNNAIAATYANAGPSAVLVDIRRAMELLGMAEVAVEWTHWNARGEREWTT